ncbi:hypothetical protein M0R45_014045 [Rubus argutus]|uniref:Pentatricopeptide repeat-containing protein n=1 Tax=Rubus argutus TaxID=59490 RepID=A0AAW1XKH6_RUBAR
MPKCPTQYSKLLTTSIHQRLKNRTLFSSEFLSPSLQSHFSALSIPSTMKNPRPQFPTKSSIKVPTLGLTNQVIQRFIRSLRITRSLGDFRSLEKVLDRMKHERRVFIERSFIAMFKACGKAHLPNKAVELFHRMVDEFQCRRTVKSFNSVLNVIVQEGHYSHALDFYSHVVGNNNMNISPNVLSYNLIIKAMCRFGLVDKAVEKFREMPVRGCTPDVFTYCTLMDGLCKENRIDEAVFLLDEMQIEGCSPSPATFNVLIDAICKKGDLARAAKLIDNMFLKGCVSE